MKRLLFLLVAALLVSPAFATPVVEEDITEITILSGAIYEGSPQFRYAVDKFHEDFPNVEVRALPLDLSTGSSMTMQALDQAGLAPNAYWDYIGRVAEYTLPGYALPLDDYIRNLDQFNDGVLDPYRQDGVLYAIPDGAQCNGMAINLDIMEDIGYTVPDNWTIDDFLEMCELVKQFYGGEKWGTMMYAKTMSGDYQINTFWGSFGAEMYDHGDFSRTTIRETGGVKTHEFYQTLMRNGYIPPNSATLSDGESFGMWGMGKFAAVPFFPGWVEMYQKQGVDKGFDKFDVTFIEFPTATGKPVPVYATGVSSMVRKTGTYADVMAARFVEYLTDAGAQAIVTRLVGVPSNRKDSILESPDPFQAQTGALAAAYGIQDVGLTNPLYSAVRAQHVIVLRQLLNFELTPEESILLYEQLVNEALAY